jgi:hypothetical protein
MINKLLFSFRNKALRKNWTNSAEKSMLLNKNVMQSELEFILMMCLWALIKWFFSFETFMFKTII